MKVLRDLWYWELQGLRPLRLLVPPGKVLLSSDGFSGNEGRRLEADPRIQFELSCNGGYSGAAGLVRGIRGLVWRLVSPAGVGRHSGTFGWSQDRRGICFGLPLSISALSISGVAVKRVKAFLRERWLKSEVPCPSGRGAGPSSSSGIYVRGR